MARKRKQDDALADLLKTETKVQLLDLLVLVSASHPAVRRENLDYLNQPTALPSRRKKQSEGEKLLALWSKLDPDPVDLDAHGGGDHDAVFQASSLLQGIKQALSRKKIEAV